MQKIDAHIHLVGDHPETIRLLDKLELKLLNICVADQSNWREQEYEPYRRLAQEYPRNYAWCTTFDLPTFDDADYADRVIEGLERDFEAGAIACKVWKNIGMEVKRPDGTMLLVDDPLLEPIFAYLGRVDKPLLMHIAEPLACWQPLEEGTPHYGYYRANPKWHMYGRSDMPSHEALIASRDHVVARHPDLKVIGAHLGSLEYDVAEVAKRLEAYPNFVVDISARLGDLMFQDGDTVRQFFIAYQGRILFGTDMVMRRPHSMLSEEERQDALRRLRETYQAHFAYFETDDTVTHRGREARGLKLPDTVLEKFYTTNARAWYPGL